VRFFTNPVGALLEHQRDELTLCTTYCYDAKIGKLQTDAKIYQNDGRRSLLARRPWFSFDPHDHKILTPGKEASGQCYKQHHKKPRPKKQEVKPCGDFGDLF